MITISANTKFSHKIANGTVTLRKTLADNMNRQVFERMLQLYENKNHCGIGSIKHSYNALLPEKKQITIKPLPFKDYEEFGGSFTVIDNNNCLTGFSIEMPVNKKKRLSIMDVSSFMHESTHVLDFLFNPKYIANHRKMYEMDIFDKDYYKIYEKYFYSSDLPEKSKKLTLSETETEAKDAIKEVPFDEKIVFLNYIKNNLIMEYHAYNQDLKYAQILKKLGKPIDKDCLTDFGKLMFFPEKIDLIKQMIREELLKHRKAL